ncbi:probable serine/threonine-protein kinase kinX [Lutzomyia longipalpis]|uniref:probable serine/threonine-protein kinase kinX n=1 Tax=Lutzomyia longipalpis TaxID=7200 RepID=UPI0024837C2D|nr:probable serine/threonine-protein kinase kinX [Lutzomyia longipalpis]
MNKLLVILWCSALLHIEGTWQMGLRFSRRKEACCYFALNGIYPKHIAFYSTEELNYHRIWKLTDRAIEHTCFPLLRQKLARIYRPADVNKETYFKLRDFFYKQAQNYRRWSGCRRSDIFGEYLENEHLTPPIKSQEHSSTSPWLAGRFGPTIPMPGGPPNDPQIPYSSEIAHNLQEYPTQITTGYEDASRYASQYETTEDFYSTPEDAEDSSEYVHEYTDIFNAQLKKIEENNKDSKEIVMSFVDRFGGTSSPTKPVSPETFTESGKMETPDYTEKSEEVGAATLGNTFEEDEENNPKDPEDEDEETTSKESVEEDERSATKNSSQEDERIDPKDPEDEDKGIVSKESVQEDEGTATKSSSQEDEGRSTTDPVGEDEGIFSNDSQKENEGADKKYSSEEDRENATKASSEDHEEVVGKYFSEEDERTVTKYYHEEDKEAAINYPVEEDEAATTEDSYQKDERSDIKYSTERDEGTTSKNSVEEDETISEKSSQEDEEVAEKYFPEDVKGRISNHYSEEDKVTDFPYENERIGMKYSPEEDEENAEKSTLEEDRETTLDYSSRQASKAAVEDSQEEIDNGKKNISSEEEEDKESNKDSPYYEEEIIEGFSEKYEESSAKYSLEEDEERPTEQAPEEGKWAAPTDFEEEIEGRFTKYSAKEDEAAASEDLLKESDDFIKYSSEEDKETITKGFVVTDQETSKDSSEIDQEHIMTHPGEELRKYSAEEDTERDTKYSSSGEETATPDIWTEPTERDLEFYYHPRGSHYEGIKTEDSTYSTTDGDTEERIPEELTVKTEDFEDTPAILEQHMQHVPFYKSPEKPEDYKYQEFDEGIKNYRDTQKSDEELKENHPSSIEEYKDNKQITITTKDSKEYKDLETTTDALDDAEEVEESLEIVDETEEKYYEEALTPLTTKHNDEEDEIVPEKNPLEHERNYSKEYSDYSLESTTLQTRFNGNYAQEKGYDREYSEYDEAVEKSSEEHQEEEYSGEAGTQEIDQSSVSPTVEAPKMETTDTAESVEAQTATYLDRYFKKVWDEVKLKSTGQTTTGGNDETTPVSSKDKSVAVESSEKYDEKAPTTESNEDTKLKEYSKESSEIENPEVINEPPDKYFYDTTDLADNKTTEAASEPTTGSTAGYSDDEINGESDEKKLYKHGSISSVEGSEEGTVEAKKETEEPTKGVAEDATESIQSTTPKRRKPLKEKSNAMRVVPEERKKGSDEYSPESVSMKPQNPTTTPKGHDNPTDDSFGSEFELTEEDMDSNSTVADFSSQEASIEYSQGYNEDKSEKVVVPRRTRSKGYQGRPSQNYSKPSQDYSKPSATRTPVEEVDSQRSGRLISGARKPLLGHVRDTVARVSSNSYLTKLVR